MYLIQIEDSMAFGSGSLDKPPDSQWTNASSILKGENILLSLEFFFDKDQQISVEI